MRYDRNMNRNRGGWFDSGEGYGYGADRYGGPMRGGYAGYDRGYDSHYKSRLQTDYGDPFGDRASGTPIRMIRGEFRAPYDREYGSRCARGESTYDRDHLRGQGQRSHSWTGMGRGGYGRSARYDRGW